MRPGEVLDIDACQREPIHIPGSIQPNGLLFVADPDSDRILQAAGDLERFLAWSGDAVGHTVAAVLGVSLDALVRRAETELIGEPTYLDTIRPSAGHQALNVVAHRTQNLVILEAEPALRPVSAAQMLASIRSITERMNRASDLEEAFDLAAGEVRRITGYDRVMIYKFHADGSGSVLAEKKDAHLATNLNHRYPASDIPKQARELYRRNMMRVISDVGYRPARLEPPLPPGSDEPLDMSHCMLRSVSPVHLQYLKNMGVGASMSISLLYRDGLWGLIACHNTTPRVVTYEAREVCRHVGQILSQQIGAREEFNMHSEARNLDLARDRVVRSLMETADPASLLFSLSPETRQLIPSHGIAVSWKGNVAIAGSAPAEPQVRQLAAWLEGRVADGAVYATDQLSDEIPEAKSFASRASGLLAIVLPGTDPLTLMWFRAEQVEEISWAGNPHEPVEPGSRLGSLNPRRSFAVWKETVRGRSRPWALMEIDAARGFVPRAAFLLQQMRVRELNDLLQDANERLASLASTDGLTGVSNRRAFDERLQQEWARAARTRMPLAVISLDIDYFKQYNDRYGHPKGDDCLRQVSQILGSERRAADMTARIGGEEFCLLLPDTDEAGAAVVAESVRSRIEGARILHDASPNGVVTASLGVAVIVPDWTIPAETLMLVADRALYAAKQGGRNRVCRAVGAAE